MAHDLESEGYRRKADELLKRAARADNMAERGRLIDEAATWHLKAVSVATGGASSLDPLGIPLDLDPTEEAEA
jgi:hypothetical protein